MISELQKQTELADKYKWQVRDTCARAEKAEAEIKRLRGTLEYILAQAKQGYPTVLSVIKANAKAALDDEWQKTVKIAFAKAFKN